MNKKILILSLLIFVCACIGLNILKNQQDISYQQFLYKIEKIFIKKHINHMNILIKKKKLAVKRCEEEYLIPIESAEVPLGNIFPDIKTSGQVSWCFTQKIKRKATKKQFDLYMKSLDTLYDFLEDMLYYKGDHVSGVLANYEMRYKFQSFYLAKITNNKQYEVPEPYKISCKLNEKLYLPPECIKRDSMKICNIERRRTVTNNLFMLSALVFEMVETVTSDKEKQQQYMLQFYNLMYRFVMMIKESEDLMNPINSTQFMEDWNIVKIMNGQELDEVVSVPKPYPLPFP